MKKHGLVGALAGGVLVLSACLPGPDIRISTVAGTGVHGFDGDDQPAALADLMFPNDVAMDSEDNLYIADSGNRRVRRVDADTGVITTVAGTGATGFNGDHQLATLASLRPESIAFDDEDNLFIADMGQHRIRRVDAGTGIVTTVAGTGVAGSWDEEEEGLPAVDVSLHYPSGIDVDADGNLYIADSYNAMIRRVDAVSGAMTRVAGNPDAEETGDGLPAVDVQLDSLRFVTVSDDGTFYLTTDERVRRVDGTTGIISTVIGNGEWGFTGDGGPAVDAQVSYPNEVVVDDAGNLYLADGENGRVRFIDGETGIVTTVAGNGDFGYNGDGQAATSASIPFPTGLALSSSGELYVSDTNNGRIRKVTVGGAIGGIVRNGAGDIIIGSEVELFSSDDLVTPVALDETSTSGWYGFSVPPGSYVIRFVGDDTHAGEWWVDAPDGASADVIDISSASLGGPSDKVIAHAVLAGV